MGGREREQMDKNLTLLVHSLSNYSCQGRIRMKPAARSFFQGSHMGAGAKDLSHLCLLLVGSWMVGRAAKI